MTDLLDKVSQETRLKRFKSALDTVKRFRFTNEQIARLIGVNTRTYFRILDGSRTPTHDDVIQMQTAAMTLLQVQTNMLKDESFDLRAVKG